MLYQLLEIEAKAEMEDMHGVWGGSSPGFNEDDRMTELPAS